MSWSALDGNRSQPWHLCHAWTQLDGPWAVQILVNQGTVSGLYMRYSSMLVDEADYHRTGERSTHRYYDGESKIHAHSPSDPYSHTALDSTCQSIYYCGIWLHYYPTILQHPASSARLNICTGYTIIPAPVLRTEYSDTAKGNKIRLLPGWIDCTSIRPLYICTGFILLQGYKVGCFLSLSVLVSRLVLERSGAILGFNTRVLLFFGPCALALSLPFGTL